MNVLPVGNLRRGVLRGTRTLTHTEVDSRMMDGKEFAERMREMQNMEPEGRHMRADELMCELLTAWGYGDGVRIFEGMDRWYA